uniref:Uncharacterized protein n=1 Tax=Timema genevievae TaxID=629358 RepID=A0A7R9PR06_TIMGE|nr:unnamed protein product [Timema genevievae]
MGIDMLSDVANKLRSFKEALRQRVGATEDNRSLTPWRHGNNQRVNRGNRNANSGDIDASGGRKFNYRLHKSARSTSYFGIFSGFWQLGDVPTKPPLKLLARYGLGYNFLRMHPKKCGPQHAATGATDKTVLSEADQLGADAALLHNDMGVSLQHETPAELYLCHVHSLSYVSGEARCLLLEGRYYSIFNHDVLTLHGHPASPCGDSPILTVSRQLCCERRKTFTLG